MWFSTVIPGDWILHSRPQSWPWEDPWAQEAKFRLGGGGGIKLIHSMIARSQERRTVISAKGARETRGMAESVGLGSWQLAAGRAWIPSDLVKGNADRSKRTEHDHGMGGVWVLGVVVQTRSSG
jgi:hypothetical protein